jgi:hypothetical protein
MTKEPTPFVETEEFIFQLIITCFWHWNNILAVTKLKIIARMKQVTQ